MLRFHAGLRGCDGVQVLDVEMAGKYYWRIVRGVCEIYTDAEAVEADAHVAPPQPLPGEGRSCKPPPTSGPLTASEPTPCPAPLVCANKVCASPYR